MKTKEDVKNYLSQKVQSLSKSQKSELENYYINFKEFMSNPPKCDEKELREGGDYLYGLVGYKPPKEVIILESPLQVQMYINFLRRGDKELAIQLKNGDLSLKEARELSKKDFQDTPCSSYGNFSDIGWLSKGIYLRDKMGIEFDKDIYDILEALRKVCFNSFYSIQLEDYLVSSQPPVEIHLDDENSLHNLSEAAIRFSDGFENYYIGGRYMHSDDFNKYKNGERKNFKDFMKIDNEDLKALIITIIQANNGEEGLLKFLGAEQVDQKKVNHSNGREEILTLYKTKETYSFLSDRHGNSDQPYAWLGETCPSTGAQYLINTSADFTDVIDAAKFARGSAVPFEVPYDWKSFTN